MTAPVIIDAVVVLILVGFTVFGARRGLLQTLAGLVIVVVALVGAGMIAATFSGPAAKLAAPLIEKQIEKQIEKKIDAAIAEQAPAPSSHVDEDSQLEELLSLLGLDTEVRDSLAEKAKDTVRDTGVSVTAAVVTGIAQSILYGVLYTLSFVALTVLLHVLFKAMGLLTKLPGIHSLNALGGGLLGLIEGALLLFLAVWAARRLGVSFEAQPFADAHILVVFTTHTPLSVLTFFK